VGFLLLGLVGALVCRLGRSKAFFSSSKEAIDRFRDTSRAGLSATTLDLAQHTSITSPLDVLAAHLFVGVSGFGSHVHEPIGQGNKTRKIENWTIFFKITTLPSLFPWLMEG
jgi:hypothetical protein